MSKAYVLPLADGKDITIPREQKIKVVSYDQAELPKETAYETSVVALLQSGTIKDLIETMGGVPETLDIPHVSSPTLLRVLQYLEEYLKVGEGTWENKYVETDFGNSASVEALSDLILAAEFLNIPQLVKLVAKKIAEFLSISKPETIRSVFALPDPKVQESRTETTSPSRVTVQPRPASPSRVTVQPRPASPSRVTVQPSRVVVRTSSPTRVAVQSPAASRS